MIWDYGLGECLQIRLKAITVIVIDMVVMIQLMASSESRDALHDAVMTEVKRHFRPEFLNRVDDSVVFQPLSEAQTRDIAGIQVARLLERLRGQGIELTIGDDILSLIAEAGFDPLDGARPLQRLIQRMIENPLAEAILSGDLDRSESVEVVMGETGLILKGK